MLPRFSLVRTVPAPSWCVLSSMPLRAKILNPAISSRGQAPMSTEVEIPREQPGDEPDDVLFNTLYGLRTIELNRPKKYNSLNASMARKILPRLKEWEKSQLANVIVIKGRGDKAFCAGGDVAALVHLRKTGPEGKEQAKEFFGLEYQLDQVIATYNKPYIAFMDGITMGGGVGLSVHAPFRIATERTEFAMPETGIGFFPDVGASFFLPRLDGQVGTYLGLTGNSLTGVDAFYAGVATHYLHSSSLPDLESRLAELHFNDYDTLAERWRLVESTLEEFSTGLPHDRPMLIAGALREAIDRAFSPATVPGIMAALEGEASRASKSELEKDKAIASWAESTLETLKSRSPTSLRVACRQMQVGLGWNINETFQAEHIIACRMMDHPDFDEGVTARIIDKPRRAPQWQAVHDDDDNQARLVDDFFQFENQPRLPLLTPAAPAFQAYPFTSITCLPRDKDVERVIRDPGPLLRRLRPLQKSKKGGIFGYHASGPAAEAVREELASRKKKPATIAEAATSEGDDQEGEGEEDDDDEQQQQEQGTIQTEPPRASYLTRRKVLNHFLRRRDHKAGVEEKVTEILKRKTMVVDPRDPAEERGGEGRLLSDEDLENRRSRHDLPIEKTWMWRDWKCVWVD